MMKRKFLRLLPGVLLMILLSGHASAARLLIPVGRIVGLELRNNTVTVVSFEEGSPAEAAGVKEGDRLLRIDRRSITTAEDVRQALNESNGTVTLTLQRGDELATIKLSPTITERGPIKDSGVVMPMKATTSWPRVKVTKASRTGSPFTPLSSW